ncbi:MAG: FAD-binding oxidoreductase [Halioglobus sp.]
MVASWGRLPIDGPVQTLEADWRFEELPVMAGDDTLLAFGNGRSYGDSCINSQASHISTRRLNRFIKFDREQGILHCESGLTLDEILQLIVPTGWFLPVVPGTRFITLGGAIANDVHGKNHHRAGSFGCHVRSLELLRSDRSRPVCSPEGNRELFAATIGGLGLTGLITSAEIRLIPINSCELVTENLTFSSVSEFVDISNGSADWEYSVAWIDSFARKGQVGRGIFSRAKHAEKPSGLQPKTRRLGVPMGVPFAPPFSLINKYTVDYFNRAYYAVNSGKKGRKYSHYQPFFFPLDAIANWNRIYGSSGFYQYQCLIPGEAGQEAVQQLLNDIHLSGEGSFLAVLKEFGEIRSPGLLSFPRPGLTLALDFPNRGEKTRRLLEMLDKTVERAGGALYPAKDARMSPALFATGYPAVDEFISQLDPAFSSAFWRRVRP